MIIGGDRWLREREREIAFVPRLTRWCRIQRYEGASTLYGPNTLDAYINRTLSFLPYIKTKSPPTPPPHSGGPYPPDNSNTSLSFIPGVVRDSPPLFKQFGDVISDVGSTEYRYGDRVSATFVGANPRNDLRLEGTYAAVEQQRVGTDSDIANGRTEESWEIVRDDFDWGLIFQWKRTSGLLGTSEVEISWEVESWTQPGVYRLRYFGNSKSLAGSVTEFTGTSGIFQITKEKKIEA
jgi:neutral ceramidase